MKRKKIIISFCTIAATVAAIILLKEKRYLSNNQKIDCHPKDAILLGEAVKILPIVIYDE